MLVDHLPDGLQDLVEIIGLVPTLALVAVYGGNEFYVPLAFPDDHPVVKMFGADLAAKISYHFGGGVIAIAKAVQMQRYERDAAIAALRPTMTVGALARKFHLSERAVWAILQRHRAAQASNTVVYRPESSP